MDFTESYPESCSSVALAARSGNLVALRRLVEQGKSVESQDNRGWRPIHEAAFWNHADCVEFLTQLDDIQINAYTFEGQTALWLAADHNSLQAAQKLLEGGGLVNLPNNEDVTPLHCAAARGFELMSKLLVENGANVNLPDYGFYTPLHEAAIQGHHAILEMLLLNGADVSVQDSHGRTPLFCGAQSHSCQIVGSLVQRSAPSLINLKAHDGATSIMLAAQSGCLNCVKLLVEHGANPDIKANDGIMAVHLALVGGHKEALEYLLKKTDHSFIEQSGAPNEHRHSHRITEGVTWSTSSEPANIFSLAVSYDRLNLVEVLIEGGLNPDNFPSPLNSTILQRLGYRWLTPLGLVLCHSPFSDASLEATRSFLSFPCALTRMDNASVPPLLAFVASANFQEESANQLLFAALDLLIENDALELRCAEKAVILNVALRCNPKALSHILHTGYPIDFLFLEKFFTIFLPMDVQPDVVASFSSLYVAGFPVPSDAGEDVCHDLKYPLQSLKQLCRKIIHTEMINNVANLPISKCKLPLPEVLVKYLCFDDVHL